MVRAYLAGKTLREAGALHGFSALACRTALLKFGVARRTRSAAQRIHQRPSAYGAAAGAVDPLAE
jgi:hypothetical protein